MGNPVAVDMMFNQAYEIARFGIENTIQEARANELEQAAKEVLNTDFRKWLLAKAKAIRSS